MYSNGILLFGGTFDPIHYGHLLVSRNAAEQLAVEKIILIPAAQPPHKQQLGLTAVQERLGMTRLAVEDDELFEVSDCELQRSGPGYTLDTVRYFRERYGAQKRLYWLIGADTIKDLPYWYKIEQLVEECTIVTAGRPNCATANLSFLEKKLDGNQITHLRKHILDTPLVDISSTTIRKRVREGLPISYLVPTKVRDYIVEHELYRGKKLADG